METSTVNPELLNTLGWIVILGSLFSATLLRILNSVFPAARNRLTDTLIARSWSRRQGLLLLGAFIGLSVLISLLQILPGVDQSDLAQLLIILLFSFSQIAVLQALGRSRAKGWSEDFGMARKRLKLLPLSFLIYLAVLPLIGLISLLYQKILVQLLGNKVEIQAIAQLISDSNSWVKAGYIALAVVAAPLYEEIIFRGVLFPMAARRIGLPGGMLAISAVFALLHFHLPSLMPLFLLSIVLCLAYWRTGSLWTSIGLHALFNGATVLALVFNGSV
jgi:membrane protease YdiL (CAAX protease family)